MHGTPAIYFTALNRHFTVCGVDRSLFYLFVGISLAIAFSARLSLGMGVVAGGIFLGLHAIGVLVTRLDPQILLIYRRHIHWQSYYDPHPGINAPIPLLKSSVPFYGTKRGLPCD
jgi:type IV secretory pathway TrbD component